MLSSCTRPLAAALLVAGAAATFTVAPAQAQSLMVQQGDAVRIGGTSTCTIGYNDRGTGYSYTAGHCGNTGDRVVVPSTGAQGTFTASPLLDKSDTGNDWGLITWDDGTVLASNGLSGDTVLDPAKVSKGERVCFQGARSGQALCGPFAGAIGNNVYFDAPDGRSGDSGGPVWIPGKGFLGVYSGFSTISNDNRSARLARGSQPNNGPGVNRDAEIQLIGNTKELTAATDYEARVPGGNAALATAKLTVQAQQRSSESGSAASSQSKSSESKTLPVILAVAVGALIASLPAIAQMIAELAPLYL